MASVNLRGLQKSFGAAQVLHGIDLDIPDGAFVALVGPSGCGKSTLLRIIAGLDEASGGDVCIGGELMNELSPRDRNIAMVFQSYALYPHMSVAENMGFNLRLAGRPKQEIDTRVQEAARILNLSELLDRRPGQLSGGQRQRVAMGRALVRNPAVFLFDEPLSNLDAKLRVQMRAEIKLLHQRMATTSVYVTHDQIEAMTLADIIVVLNGGRIEQIGAPMDLYKAPVNLFVAGFIGSPSMNILDGVIDVTPSGVVVRFEEGSEQPLPAHLAPQKGHTVAVGMRPEHIRPADDGAAIGGEVLLIEPTGAQTHVVFRYGGVDMTAVVEGEYFGRVGSRFAGSIAPELVHVFDPRSGSRMSSGIQ